ncbi:MAG: putative lipid II flippase FtsW [Patescibacteria group bacterium]
MRKLQFKKQKKIPDKRFFILAITLTVLGLIAIADASSPAALSNFSDRFYYVKQQLIWGLIGIAVLLVASKIHYSFWEKIAMPLFVGNIILLILVLIPGIGTKILGARRWIFIGPTSFQPSELIKLTLSIYLAKVAAKEKKSLSYFIPIAAVAALIMLEPDLGTTIVVGAIGMVQAFVAGVSFIHFLGALVAAALASILLVVTSDYRRDRLLTFLQQSKDPLGKSYHIRQILLALGSGGIFGVGLGQSRQKFLFLPEAATDSIFAVIAEEVGFVGALVLIILFVAFIFRGIKIALNAPDDFSKILGTGLIAWIGMQIFLNIGSMVAIIPLTGIPLPFFSYGGSALTTTLLATGILLNISKYESEQKPRRRKK